MIIIEPCAGLGNRMIALASAYCAASKNRHDLTVVWKEESVLAAPLSALFSLPENVAVEEIREQGFKADFIGQIKGNSVKKKYRKSADVFFEPDDIAAIYDREGSKGIDKLCRDNKCLYIKATNPFYDIYDTEGAFDFMIPNKDILDKVSEVFGDAAGNVVGIHIRRTDHIEAIKNSPLELFKEKIEAEIAGNSQVKFYVASDDISVIKELKGEYGKRILSYDSKVLDRNSLEGIRDAYVEMIILSRCTKIYGSFNSTFSKMASCIGHIPLIVVKK